MPPSAHDREAMRALRRRWWAALSLGVAALLVLSTLLRRAGESGTLWLAAATPMLAYTFAFIGAHLDQNRHSERPQRLLPVFGPGTGVTLARAIALAALTGFLPLPWPGEALVWRSIAWLPMALYTSVAVADWFDGYLARRADHTTQLGARLDLELDGAATLVAVGLAISYGQLPLWYLAVGLARYLYVMAVWAASLGGTRVRPLPPSQNRRLWAGFQMGFLSAALWPIVPAEGAHLAAWCFGVPFLLGFSIDTLVATGRLDPESERYLWLHHLWSELERWLPVFLRATLLVIVSGWLRSQASPLQPAGWSEVATSWHWAAPGRWQALAAGLLLLGCILAVCGLLARLGAFLTLFGFALEISAHGMPPGTALALASALGVLLLGSGALSLWRPEEEALRRRY